jgi:hypothetical protein
MLPPAQLSFDTIAANTIAATQNTTTAGWSVQQRAATMECLSSILQKELAMYTNSCKGYLDPSDPSMITAADRMELVDWCYHIVDSCQYPRDTVVTAMAMVDAFLSTPSSTADAARASDEALYSQNKFQLLTIAALYCSIKAMSNVAVPADVFVHDMCGGLYTKEEIETMERTLLSGSSTWSSWRFAPASTAYEVGRTVLSSLVPYTNLPEATWSFLLDEVQYQTEHAVRDYYFSTQRTSTIALAAILNAVKRLSCNTHQEMLRNALTCIVEHFDFDDSKLIFIAQQRLQGLLHGKVAHPQTQKDPKSLDHSMKSLDVSISMKSLDLSDTDFNVFMNSFETEFDKTMLPMPMPSEDYDVDAATPVATSVRLMNPTPSKPTTPNLSVVPLPTVTVTPSQPAATEDKTPTKPLRPLSAYHMFLQLEKEFIIQTMAGEEDTTTDKSIIHDEKVYLDYVPERYRQIKLSPEWYFGPGKRRKKRKHRKQHGKVGFLELSRMIASRWAKLDETNPEVKSFVQKIADQELAEYRREMKVYNRYIKDNDLSKLPSSASSTTTKTKNTKKRKQEHGGSEQSSQEEGAAQVISSTQSEHRRVTLECTTDQEEDGSPPCVITPSSTSTSLESADELGPLFVLGNDLNGFSYLPATKF